MFPFYENSSEWDDFGEVINPDDYVIKEDDMDLASVQVKYHCLIYLSAGRWSVIYIAFLGLNVLFLLLISSFLLIWLFGVLWFRERVHLVKTLKGSPFFSLHYIDLLISNKIGVAWFQISGLNYLLINILLYNSNIVLRSYM